MTGNLANKMENLETRVGYATTSFLERETRKYIIANTKNGKYIGDIKYIQILNELSSYNAAKNDERS